MIRIRLRRIGKKGQPYYRVVVAEHHAKRDGAFIETLGSYDPHLNPPALQIDAERTREWIARGAQPSESAAKILRRAGVVEAAVAAPVAVAVAVEAAAPVEPEKKPAARARKKAAE